MPCTDGSGVQQSGSLVNTLHRTLGEITAVKKYRVVPCSGRAELKLYFCPEILETILRNVSFTLWECMGRRDGQICFLLRWSGLAGAWSGGGLERSQRAPGACSWKQSALRLLTLTFLSFCAFAVLKCVYFSVTTCMHSAMQGRGKGGSRATRWAPRCYCNTSIIFSFATR